MIKWILFTVIFLIAESENVNSMSDIYDLNGDSKKTTVIISKDFNLSCTNLAQFGRYNSRMVVNRYLERRELTIKQGEWNIGWFL